MIPILIYSNVLTAFSAAFLTLGIIQFNGLQVCALYPVFILCSILFVYNAQRLYKVESTFHENEWLKWVKSRRKLLMILSVLCGLVALITLVICIPLSSLHISLLLLSASIGYFYVVPFRKVALRQIPVIKGFLVSVVWTILLFTIPYGSVYPSAEGLCFLSYFLGLALPFDIRDQDYDRDTLKTLPHVIGNFGTRVISIICLLIFHLVYGFLHQDLFTDPLFWISGLFPLLLILILRKNNPPEQWSLIDLSMAFLGLALLI